MLTEGDEGVLVLEGEVWDERDDLPLATEPFRLVIAFQHVVNVWRVGQTELEREQAWEVDPKFGFSPVDLTRHSVVEADASVLGEARVLVCPGLNGVAGALAIDVLDLAVFPSRVGAVMKDADRLTKERK